MVRLKSVDEMLRDHNGTLPYLPPAIPADLAPRLTRLHGHPIVWWVGQFLKYLLRPQPELMQDIQDTQNKLGFVSPIVG